MPYVDHRKAVLPTGIYNRTAACNPPDQEQLEATGPACVFASVRMWDERFKCPELVPSQAKHESTHVWRLGRVVVHLLPRVSVVDWASVGELNP